MRTREHAPILVPNASRNNLIDSEWVIFDHLVGRQVDSLTRAEMKIAERFMRHGLMVEGHWYYDQGDVIYSLDISEECSTEPVPVEIRLPISTEMRVGCWRLADAVQCYHPSVLQTYYVIWRGDEDDFMVTRLDLDPLMMAPGDSRLSNSEIVAMCWDAEYLAGSPGEVNPYVGEDCASYDLLAIVTGTDVQFVLDD